MIADITHSPLINNVTKVIVLMVALVYLFGIFWYPSPAQAMPYLILVLTLGFRVSLHVGQLVGVRLAVVFLSYGAVAQEQLYSAYKYTGSFEKAFSTSSMLVLSAIGIAFLLDSMRLKR